MVRAAHLLVYTGRWSWFFALWCTLTTLSDGQVVNVVFILPEPGQAW